MRQSVIVVRRPVAWALTVMFAIMVSAECARGREMTQTEMDCCAAMGPACEHSARQPSCCSAETQRVDQVVAAKRITVPPPDMAVASIAADPHTLQNSFVDRGPRFDRFTPKPPGIPTYLLISTLLI